MSIYYVDVTTGSIMSGEYFLSLDDWEFGIVEKYNSFSEVDVISLKVLKKMFEVFKVCTRQLDNKIIYILKNMK